MMPSKTPHDAANDASALVARYVQKRLVVECAERGVASRIARELGFTTAHIANAKNYGSVGDKFARAIAAYWGMTYDQLQAVATGKASAPDVAPAVDPVASPAPPPTSDVRITDDATDAIVNDAFNPVRHKASDVPPVGGAPVGHAPRRVGVGEGWGSLPGEACRGRGAGLRG